MRIAIIFLIAGVLQAGAIDIYSQNARLSLDFSDSELIKVLGSIEEASDYYFLFNDKLLNIDRKVDIRANDQPISKVLDDLFTGTDIKYTIVGRKIILAPEYLTVNSENDSEQQQTLRGKVTDSSTGEPMPGVNIVIKGTSIGALTDAQGNYSLSITDPNSVILVSFIGYAAQEITIGGRSTINIQLEPSVEALEEVVVTALGIQKEKKALSYSVQDIKGETFNETHMGNLTLALSGRVAGMTITSASSGVGADTKVLLRGNRSISGSSQPLYVVDGITLNDDIANMSPDDIESISVLKGANAAALYGSRASNGAIVVTTKSGRGAANGVTSSIGFTFTASDPNILLKFQNEYGQGADGVYSERAITSWGPKFDGSPVNHWSNDPKYIANELGGSTTYLYVAQPDNIRDYFQIGTSLATNVGVNIKSEISNVVLGYTYTDAASIVKGNDLKGHNLNLRVNSNITQKLEIDSKLNYIRQDFANVLTTGENFNNPMRYLYQIPRNIRTQDMAYYEFISASGQNKQHFWVPGYNGAGNPYWTRNNVMNPQLRERVLGMVSLSYNIMNDLTILGRSALDRSNSMAETKLKNDTYVTGANGSYTRRNSDSYEWNSDVLITYRKSLFGSFSINLNAGANNRISSVRIKK